MIRGVNRQTIEVKGTGNMYHESAYLAVKPEYASAERELLKREVREILCSMDVLSGMKWARGMSFWVTRVTPPVAVAAAVVILYFAMI